MGNICSSTPEIKPIKVKNMIIAEHLHEINIRPRVWTISLKIKKEGNVEILPSEENLSEEFAKLKQEYDNEKSNYDEFYNKSAKLSMKLFEIEEEKRKNKENVDELKGKIDQISRSIRKNSFENIENEIESLNKDIERDTNQKQDLEEEFHTVCESFWPLALEYENTSKTLKNWDESIIIYYNVILQSLQAHLDELERNKSELQKELAIKSNSLLDK